MLNNDDDEEEQPIQQQQQDNQEDDLLHGSLFSTNTFPDKVNQNILFNLQLYKLTIWLI